MEAIKSYRTTSVETFPHWWKHTRWDWPNAQTVFLDWDIHFHHFIVSGVAERGRWYSLSGSHMWHKRMQAGVGQVSGGSSREINTECMPADRAQANQAVWKVPKPILASLRHSCQQMLEGSVENGQQIQRPSFSFEETAKTRISQHPLTA